MHNKNNIEILAPGGDLDSIKAAIIAGADAVYCGLDRFNARNRATNITFDDLQKILPFAHKNRCKIFLTLNIIILEAEIPAIIRLLNKLVNTSIDGIIIQDLGLFYIIKRYFKSFQIHASTQLTTHNIGQIMFLKKLCAERVNLSRELSIKEIKNITKIAHENKIETEVFVHGSNCISFSGLCYLSSFLSGNSGNRGRCSQPCRNQYEQTIKGINFPLNIKDNLAFLNIKDLAEIGVDSFKIEGRIKQFHYVYVVVKTWEDELKNFYENKKLRYNKEPFYKVFNRDFTNDFLKGNITSNMFIDNPRDHSAIHLSKEIKGTDDPLKKAKDILYKEKTEIINSTKKLINKIILEKIKVQINVSGNLNFPLKIELITPQSSFVISSNINMSEKGREPLSHKMLLKKFNTIEKIGYCIKSLNFNIDENLFLPFNEITSIKKRILFILLGSKNFIEPIEIKKLKETIDTNKKQSLSILIDNKNDIDKCNNMGVEVYYKIPNYLEKDYESLKMIFKKNKNIIPWFPSILIDNSYKYAVKLIEEILPKKIVTENTGIAYIAYQNNIKWIAGPHMNIVNSYTLINLKDQFNCYGAFISNEINKKQIRHIKNTTGIKLFYQIYGPIDLMTSRQCLLQQTTDCKKTIFDNRCLAECKKQSTITDLNKNKFYINKTINNFNSLYSDKNFLNLEIIDDIPHKFDSFLIDLRNIETDTIIKTKKQKIIELFKNIINKNNKESELELKKSIFPTTNKQYKKGL